jgi:hypothetical protein
MLMLMKSQTEAMRALAAVAAVSLDAARLHPKPEERRRHQAFADLLIPVVKGWCTETSVEIASLGVQVHGGMGFIEDTGVAQQFRDSRITPIYEGTTAIQANDLIGRKLARDGGVAAQALIVQMRALPGRLQTTPGLSAAAAVFVDAVDALERSVEYVVSRYGSEFKQVSVGAVPLLKLFGIVAGGWQLLRSAAIAGERLAGAGGRPAVSGGVPLPENFHRAKIETAGFYAHHVLSQAPGLAHAILHGASSALAEGVL